MQSSVRLGLCLAAIVLAVAGFKFAGTDQFPEKRDLPEFPAIDDEVQQQLRFARELDARLRLVLLRQAVKTRVLSELIAGRITLIEAAVRVRDLITDPIRFWEQLRL